MSAQRALVCNIGFRDPHFSVYGLFVVYEIFSFCFSSSFLELIARKFVAALLAAGLLSPHTHARARRLLLLTISSVVSHGASSSVVDTIATAV